MISYRSSKFRFSLDEWIIDSGSWKIWNIGRLQKHLHERSLQIVSLYWFLFRSWSCFLRFLYYKSYWNFFSSSLAKFVPLKSWQFVMLNWVLLKNIMYLAYIEKRWMNEMLGYLSNLKPGLIRTEILLVLCVVKLLQKSPEGIGISIPHLPELFSRLLCSPVDLSFKVW